MFGSLKVVRVYANETQKDGLLALFPEAKCDTATTGSIELLPRGMKDTLLDMVVRERCTDIVGRFLCCR